MVSSERRAELPERVRSTANRHEMFRAGQTVVVAVSGGPDSVALLHCLHTLREDLQITLVAAHLDHGFRGEESAADAEYVRDLCSRLDIPCHAAYENVPELKKRARLSSQEAARAARHAFLRKIAEESGAERIALGHTSDDRVETILLNLFRGAGSEGLGGFPPVRLPLVRPLYDAARADTVEYCALNCLEPRTDPSNESLDYARNRVRRELLPYLVKNFNPRLSDALLRMSDLVTADNEALTHTAMRVFPHVQREQATDAIVLSADLLISCPMAVQRRILRLAIARVRGDLNGIGSEPIDAALRAAESGEHLVVQLPEGGAPACRILVSGKELCVARDTKPMELGAWRVELPLSGLVDLPFGGWITTRVLGSAEEARAGYSRMSAAGRVPGSGQDALLLPLSSIRLPLAARSWRKGDRMRPRGLNGSKKLQDIFVDRKVPLDRRLCVPVIVEAEVSGGSGEAVASPIEMAGAGADGRILGLLGVQGSEYSIPLRPGIGEEQIFGACVLIMALSDSGVT